MKLTVGMRVAYKSPDDGRPQYGVIDRITERIVFVLNDDGDIDDLPLPQANPDLEILHQQHNNPDTYFDNDCKPRKTVFKDGCTFTFLRVARKAIDGENGFLYRQSWSTGYQDVITDSPLI